MKRDDIIRMAREAASQHGHTIKPTDEIVETLTSFAALVAAAERKACANARSCEFFIDNREYGDGHAASDD